MIRGLNFPRARLFAAFLLCLALLAPALSGCGKKNDPLPPKGVPNTYPRPYPSG